MCACLSARVCVHVRVCACVHVCRCTYLCVFVCVCMCMLCVHAYSYMCVYVCMHICVHSCLHMCVHVCFHLQVNPHYYLNLKVMVDRLLVLCSQMVNYSLIMFLCWNVISLSYFTHSHVPSTNLSPAPSTSPAQSWSSYIW